MKAARGQCAVACTPDNRLFAMGSTDSMDALRSAECYEEVNGDVSWHFISPMNDRRNRPNAAVFKSSLLVMGGWNDAGHIDHTHRGSNYVHTIEIFGTKANGHWTFSYYTRKFSASNHNCLTSYLCGWRAWIWWAFYMTVNTFFRCTHIKTAHA